MNTDSRGVAVVLSLNGLLVGVYDVVNLKQEYGDQCQVSENRDNCIDVFNPEHIDSDQDNIGDAYDFMCGDAGSNVIVSILDAVYLIGYIFGGGPAPCAACP